MRPNSRLQTASQSALPPPPATLFDLDPLVTANTHFNESRTHRYTLYRHWAPERIKTYVAFCLMNPSGADEDAGDSTVDKCVRFAKKWTWRGQRFGSFYMLNAFALRATKPKELFEVSDPVGPGNDEWIRKIASEAALVVVGWGTPGTLLGRGARVAEILRECCHPDNVRCFKFNKDGTPIHPLYQNETIQADNLLPFFGG